LAFRDNAQLDAREVRATTELPFPASVVFPVVCDLTAYEALVPGVTEARLIAGVPPADCEVYLRYAPRFLVVAARDVVVRVRTARESANRLECTWSEVGNRVAEHKGTVRMPLLRGAWMVETVDANRSRVTYQVAARPGGRIPGWLVRRGAVQALPEVIDKVRERLRSVSQSGSREGAYVGFVSQAVRGLIHRPTTSREFSIRLDIL
jgi:hypothetical protein